jgi:hypothetical protein
MVAKAALPYAAWEPDKASISGVTADAYGVVSRAGFYEPHKDLVLMRPGVAMNDTAIGGAGFYDLNGGVRIFMGDASKLYTIQARAPVDVSKIGGYTANKDWAWTFRQFGNSVYAVARGVPQMQRFDLASSTSFADVATGPGFSDCIFRIREFMFSGFQKTLKNSCFNNPLDWNPTSLTGIQAGSFDLPSDGGDIVTGTGGQFGVVFQERKIHRLTYVGGTTSVFQRDEIENKRGALGPNAISRYGMFTFFASEDGIRVTDGSGESQGIGEGKIDLYFTKNLNFTQRARVSMAVDVEKRLLKVVFPTGGTAFCNEMLIYSMQTGQWTHDSIDVDLLFEAPKQGVTVDDTAAVQAIAGTTFVDQINIPVDSPVWRETRKQIMAVNSTHALATFEGLPRAAVIETGYGETMPGRMGFVTEVWPLVDAATLTTSITTKLKRLSDPSNNGLASSLNVHGYCPVLAHARWLRARTMIPAGVAWTEASGIDWDARPAGEL